MSRGPLAILSPALAALVALTVALPRGALRSHSHPGGTGHHVHAESDAARVDALLAHWDRHGDARSGHPRRATHRHVHASAAAPFRPGAGYVATAAAATDHHWHQQQRLQRGVLIAAAPIITSLPVGTASQQAPRQNAHTVVRRTHARGPPAVVLSA